MRHIEIFLRDGVTPVVHEVKMNGPALKIHAGFTGHSALQLLVWQVVAPAVLDEHGAGLDKAEGHVGIHAFLPERFDPIKIAGAGTIVVFAAADDLLDLPGGKVLPDAYWPDEGRAHDALVLEGQVKQNFVRAEKGFHNLLQSIMSSTLPASSKDDLMGVWG